IVVLDMPLLDTSQYKDSMGTFIADLVLQIVAWVAQDERERIRNRQRVGIDAAMRQGKIFGRPRAQMTDEFKQFYWEWQKGNITATKDMEQSNTKKSNFHKLERLMQ